MDGIPWVAINPKTKTLYTALWNDCCAFQMFTMDSLEHIGEFRIAEGQVLPGEIQGGAFYEGFLYICVNANDEVWKVDLDTGLINLELSDEYPKHGENLLLR